MQSCHHSWTSRNHFESAATIYKQVQTSQTDKQSITACICRTLLFMAFYNRPASRQKQRKLGRCTGREALFVGQMLMTNQARVLHNNQTYADTQIVIADVCFEYK